MSVLRLAAIIAVAALGGCTHLETLPDRDVTPASEAIVGTTYSLPMLQYKMTVSRALIGCPTLQSFKLPDGSTLEVSDNALAFKVLPQGESRYVPGERYVVDYDALSSPFKVTGFSIGTYPNGNLKTINVSADDRSGEVAKEGIKAAFLVASMASGSPAAVLATAAAAAPSAPLVGAGPPGVRMMADAGGAGAARRAAEARKAAAEAREAASKALRDRVRRVPTLGCTPDATALVAKAKENSKQRKSLTADLEVATKEVERLTVIANLKAADANDAARLAAAMEREGTARLKLTRLTEARAEIDAELADTRIDYWPRSFDERGPGAALQPDAVALKRFAEMLQEAEVEVISPTALAEWLGAEGKAYADEFVAANKDTLGGYLSDAGQPIKRTPVSPNCEGAGRKLAKCIEEKLFLYPQLLPAATGMSDCSAVATDDAAECVRKVRVREIQEVVAKGEHRHKKSAHERDHPLGRNARDAVVDRGVFVRAPAEGQVDVVQRVAVADGPNVKVEEKKVLQLGPASAPQLGQLRYLPFSNRMFEANELALSLREDGSIEKFDYKKTRSSAAGATAAASDALSQLQAWRTEQNARVKTVRENQIAELQFQIDTLTKQKELLALRSPPTPDALAAIKEETARIDAETALLNSRLARLNAERMLSEAGGGQP